MTPCDALKNRLVEFALGELGRGKARRLERHLRECRGCTAELERLRDRDRFLAGRIENLVRTGGPSPGFGRDLLATIESLKSQPVRRVSPSVLLAAAGAIALLAMILIGLRSGPWPGTAGKHPVAEVSEWRAPTDWFLISVADELLESDAIVGDLFYPIENDTIQKYGGES
ncbi:MAG: zf-HC2 domain-containing protein [Acidobacteriota bacterium]